MSFEKFVNEISEMEKIMQEQAPECKDETKETTETPVVKKNGNGKRKQGLTPTQKEKLRKLILEKRSIDKAEETLKNRATRWNSDLYETLNLDPKKPFHWDEILLMVL